MGKFIRSTPVRVLALILALGLILTPAMGGTFACLLAQTQSIINTFLSGLTPDGAIILRKEVTHPFGESYAVPDQLRFDFQVCLGPDFAGQTVETSQGDHTADQNGTILLSLAPGGAVSIRGIDQGTVVTVTELPGPGFAPEGGATRTVTAGTGDLELRYNNIYTPAPADPVGVSVTGIKLLEGRDWQEGDRFDFTLEFRHASAGDQWQTLGTRTVEYDPNDPDFDRFDFTDLVRALTFDTAGEYAFRVSEVSGDLGGIVYDQVVSYFDIAVGDDDMDGTLEIQNVTGYQNAEAYHDPETGEFHVEVTICNRYAPEGTADVTIPIRKTVTSFSGQEQTRAGYTFELYDEWGILIDRSQETSAAGEIAMRLTFDAWDAGQVFRYTLVETGGGQTLDGMSYDSRSYPIEITVTDNLDGTISAAVTELPEWYEFENIYDPVNTQADFGGTKVLVGRELRAGEFTFAIYEADSGFHISGQPIQTVTNDADGSFSFAPMEYNRVGTYRYAVVEMDPGAPGILSDDAVFHVTVTVTDEGGMLRAETAITDSLGDPTVILFTNIYQPKAVPVPLEGRKVLYGMELAAGQYWFELYESDESWQLLGDPKRVSHNSRGSFVFDDLTFHEPGVYRYVVREDTSRPMQGVEYDERHYAVTITVFDDLSGQLRADVALQILGEGKADEIRFENIYTEPPTTQPTDPTPGPTEPPTEPSTEPTTEPTVPPDTGKPGGGHEPGNPDHTDPPDGTDKPATPPTGDDSQLELYILLLVLSGAGFLVLLLTDRDRKKRK